MSSFPRSSDMRDYLQTGTAQDTDPFTGHTYHVGVITMGLWSHKATHRRTHQIEALADAETLVRDTMDETGGMR